MTIKVQEDIKGDYKATLTKFVGKDVFILSLEPDILDIDFSWSFRELATANKAYQKLLEAIESLIKIDDIYKCQTERKVK